MAIYDTLLSTTKQILKFSTKYFIPATLLLNRFLQATASATESSANMTGLVQGNDTQVGLSAPSMAYLINHSEIFYRPPGSIQKDFALTRYLQDPQNTYDYIINTDTSNILEKPLPQFFSNANALCQVDSVALIKNPYDCQNIDARKLNTLYQNARTFGRLGTADDMVSAINIYNDMLKLIPGNDAYFNPLFKQIYWHLGSSHFYIRNLDQAKRCFELAIALATDNKNLGLIYAKLGLILNMQNQNEKAYIAHQKALKLMPENEDALIALEETKRRMLKQNTNSNVKQFQRM